MTSKSISEAHRQVPWVQFARFSTVGAIGFVVDSLILYSCLFFLEMNIYSGRVVSYIVAATTTWLLNRWYTFSRSGRLGVGRQWSFFLAVNTLGGIVNYGVYSVLVSKWMLFSTTPVLAVALGSVAGLAFNFTLSKALVFKE